MRSCLFVGFTKKSVTNGTNELRICGLLSYLTVCETGEYTVFACRFTEKPQGALYRRRGIGETFRSLRVNAAHAAPQSFGSSYAQLAGFGKTAEAAEPARKSCFFNEKLDTGQELRRIVEPKHYSVAESIYRAGHGDALNGACLQKGSADTAKRGVEPCKYGYAAACGGGYEAQQPFIRAECKQHDTLVSAALEAVSHDGQAVAAAVRRYAHIHEFPCDNSAKSGCVVTDKKFRSHIFTDIFRAPVFREPCVVYFVFCESAVILSIAQSNVSVVIIEPQYGHSAVWLIFTCAPQ